MFDKRAYLIYKFAGITTSTFLGLIAANDNQTVVAGVLFGMSLIGAIDLLLVAFNTFKVKK